MAAAKVRRWSSAPATPPAAPSPGASRARATPPASRAAASTSCSRWWRRSRPTAARRTASPATRARKRRWSRWSSRSKSTIGPIEVLVFNIGANVPEQHPGRDRAQVLQGLGDGLLRRLPERRARWPGAWWRAARPRHDPLHRRHGLAARRRRTSPPSPAPSMALRALAQSMARELGPRGIHVAHVVIDGAIDTEFIREQLPRALCAEGAGRHPEPRAHRRAATGCCTGSRATPGPTSSTCAPGWRNSDGTQGPSISISTSAAPPPTWPGRSCRSIARDTGADRATTSPSCWAACSRPPATARRSRCRPRAGT